MSTQADLQLLESVIARLEQNPVERFSYKKQAFDEDIIEGTEVYDMSSPQNIPANGLTDYDELLLDRGVRLQGASIPRMGWNHFLGRISYNLNKFVQKFSMFFGVYRAALAHNAAEYDPSAKYAHGDICYIVEAVDGVDVYAWYRRVSQSPETISGIPPAVPAHWLPVQGKISQALLPFAAPGYRHRFTIADLTDAAYDSDTWYPVTTELSDMNAEDDRESVTQVLIDVFCNGEVAGQSAVCRAELMVYARFTGFEGSSTDVLLGNSFINMETGAALDMEASPIGYTKLVQGQQAVIWLRGGSKYALWNSFASDFALNTGEYDNGLDDPIDVSAVRPFAIRPGDVKARVKSTQATEADDAVIKEQADGMLPMPRMLTAGARLNDIRTPGSYIAASASTAYTVEQTPITLHEPFELLVRGDREGAYITTQRITLRETGDVYIRMLAGDTIVHDWYLCASPDGIEKREYFADIYINSDNGSDAEDGLTPETPVRTLARAVERVNYADFRSDALTIHMKGAAEYAPFTLSGDQFLGVSILTFALQNDITINGEWAFADKINAVILDNGYALTANEFIVKDYASVRFAGGGRINIIGMERRISAKEFSIITFPAGKNIYHCAVHADGSSRIIAEGNAAYIFVEEGITALDNSRVEIHGKENTVVNVPRIYACEQGQVVIEALSVTFTNSAAQTCVLADRDARVSFNTGHDIDFIFAEGSPAGLYARHGGKITWETSGHDYSEKGVVTFNKDATADAENPDGAAGISCVEGSFIGFRSGAENTTPYCLAAYQEKHIRVTDSSVIQQSAGVYFQDTSMLDNLRTRPTSLQTTDPPSYHVIRVDVTEGGSGYALNDLVRAGTLNVDLTVTAINEDGAVLQLTFNAESLYSGDPAADGVPLKGGSGGGAMCTIRTAYAPGDLQQDGLLQFVPYSDPLVQTSRLKGYTRDFLLASGLAQNVTRLNAMRKWSPVYAYGEGEAVFFDNRWWIINPNNKPIYNESPATNPEKWELVTGGGSEAEARNTARIDAIWKELFGEGVQYTGDFTLDFYSLDGVSLTDGIWKEKQGIVEV
jgi:hypothetical protein